MSSVTVPTWEMHCRGQGLVARDAQVSKRAFVAPAAIVRPGAEIFGKARVEGASEVGRNARLSGECVVKDSRVFDYSQIGDRARVTSSTLQKDAASYDCPFVCDDAHVEDSHLEGQVRICENASVKNIRASGHVLIRGNVRAEGCELGTGAVIHEGLWTRSPRIWRTPFHYSVIECQPSEDPMQNKLITGCICHTLEWWVKNGRRAGAALGMDDTAMTLFAEIIIENFSPPEMWPELFARW